MKNTHRHFILHKPHGYLSQLVNNQNKRKNKKLLGELFEFPAGTMAIGRLDENSEGLLMLTTDGKISELIRSSKFEKEYYVLVDGTIDQGSIDSLRCGVAIAHKGETYRTKACTARLLDSIDKVPMAKRNVRDARHGPTSWISITLTEGRFRQVRKMTAAVGFPTLRLVRVRIGEYTLKLVPGEVKEVCSLII